MTSALVQLNNTFSRLIAQPIVKIRPNQINVCAQDLTLSRVSPFATPTFNDLLCDKSDWIGTSIHCSMQAN